MAFCRWLLRKDRKELEEAKVRISQLEREYRAMSLTLQNLQSALVAISRNQDVVVNDVRHIQEMVASFLNEIDPSQLMMGFPGSKDDN